MHDRYKLQMCYLLSQNNDQPSNYSLQHLFFFFATSFNPSIFPNFEGRTRCLKIIQEPKSRSTSTVVLADEYIQQRQVLCDRRGSQPCLFKIIRD